MSCNNILIFFKKKGELNLLYKLAEQCSIYEYS